MTTTVLSLHDIPGPKFRRTLRHGLTSGEDWTLVVDARTSPPPSLDRISLVLRLTRRAGRHSGRVILLVDQLTRRRLIDAGLLRWLQIASSLSDAKQPSSQPDYRTSAVEEISERKRRTA